MKKVIIIGSGLGGLSAALRLRYAGFDVTIFEKQKRVGGRSNIIIENGFRVDTGPTILVMRNTFEEFYQSIGEKISEHLNLIQLEPNYRIYFHDDTYIDLSSNMARLANEVDRFEPGSSEKLFEFIGDNARKYRLGMPFVDRNYHHITDLANPAAGWRLFTTRSHQNLYKQVSTYFQDDRLRKAFTFHPMFLGLSPFDSPAMYSLITYADLALGMWYPMGGIYAIVENMSSLALKMGIEIHTGSPVKQILLEKNRVVGIQLSSGENVEADLVVSNADLPYTYQVLLRGDIHTEGIRKRLNKMVNSCSGYLLYLGVDEIYPHLNHQALFFSEDYRANLDAIFRTKTLPDDPSFHLNVPTMTDPSLAPPGHSLIYILAPMPNLSAGIDWNVSAPIVRNKILNRLAELVDQDIKKRIIWEKQYTPEDYQHDYNAVDGTAFGSLAHNFFQSAYFRPHNKAPGIHGLYFVGQGTYPGIGMPMVMISSRLTVERIKMDVIHRGN
jgi:phytoene desaturase